MLQVTPVPYVLDPMYGEDKSRIRTPTGQPTTRLSQTPRCRSSSRRDSRTRPKRSITIGGFPGDFQVEYDGELGSKDLLAAKQDAGGLNRTEPKIHDGLGSEWGLIVRFWKRFRPKSSNRVKSAGFAVAMAAPSASAAAATMRSTNDPRRRPDSSNKRVATVACSVVKSRRRPMISAASAASRRDSGPHRNSAQATALIPSVSPSSIHRRSLRSQPPPVPAPELEGLCPSGSSECGRQPLRSCASLGLRIPRPPLDIDPALAQGGLQSVECAERRPVTRPPFHLCHPNGAPQHFGLRYLPALCQRLQLAHRFNVQRIGRLDGC